MYCLYSNSLISPDTCGVIIARAHTQEALGGFSVILLIKLLEKEPLLGRDIQQLACNFSTVLLHS